MPRQSQQKSMHNKEQRILITLKNFPNLVKHIAGSNILKHGGYLNYLIDN
ncbi:unnamed protein product [Moneuplotes crassus]|uniref:Uncharacterized protein n=1 Tax=Euplotes crassus TaxID=5936 RepID=A0AAD1U7V3_EUPCR|nr:unnamed protein product [Moneuplotes crassus]